jgi:Uma2 family endonuclease
MGTETIIAPAASTPSSGMRSYRRNVETYHRLVASGVFGDKSSIFLWKGQLVEKVTDMSKGRRHVYAVNKLDKLLGTFLPDRWFVEQDQPMEVGADSVPEPDLNVVRGRVEDYVERTPTAWDVGLVIEVADTSLADGSGEVLRAYAGSAVPRYWLVNIPRQRIEVYRRPEGNHYAEEAVYGPEEEVPVVLGDREVGRIRVRDILP